MLIQNCSFEGDEILFISVLAVTNGETAWFRVIVLMAPSVLFRFLVGLQAQNWVKGRTPSPWPQWLVEEDDPNQPIQALFRVFQTSKQIWDDIILEGPTAAFLVEEGHLYPRKKGTKVPSKDAIQDGVSHAHGGSTSSTVAMHSLNSLSLCEELPQDPSTYFVPRSLSVACK